MTFVIFMSFLGVFAQDRIFFSQRCPHWYGSCVAWVGRALKIHGCNSGVLARWDEDAKVAIISSAECALHQIRVLCQDLVGLLDGIIFQFYQVIGHQGDGEPFENRFYRRGVKHVYNYNC